MKIVVTGGAGFIGSAVIRYLLKDTTHEVINIDKLTYAGNLESLQSIEKSQFYKLFQTDIGERAELDKIFTTFKPDIVMHLAAESHVDRSISGPEDFINTNIVGTYHLLEASLSHYRTLTGKDKDQFRFHHVSTDEVYGDLDGTVDLFTESTPYAPSSPYSASKAASDHLVRAWYRTYGLPILITNCSNNYGPFQYPEKLIPQTILNAIKGKPLPIYGDGAQIRDWLYVEDHARALVHVATMAKVGSTYNIGGNNEKRNIDIVNTICSQLEKLQPNKPVEVKKYRDLITFVTDRPGHDRRYAIDASKIQNELGWYPNETFESGLQKTVDWYLKNTDWCQRVLDADRKDKKPDSL